MHEAQLVIHTSPARFKVVAAGRRFGKSYLAAMTLLLEGLKDQHVGKLSGMVYDDLRIKEVWYVAPTFEQAKGIMFPLLKMLGHSVIQSVHENTATVTLTNGRKIAIKGSDRPDTLRGRGLSYVVLDEFAFMKEEAWTKILRPALSDVEGDAMFIGTPEGKNHFFDLFEEAGRVGLPEWQSFQFKSIDNPKLQRAEIDAARESLSSENFRQEYEASFTEGAGTIFRADWWNIATESPGTGQYHIAVDLAGFSQEGIGKKGVLKVRDEHAIAIVKCGTWGWYVEDIRHGRWNVRECALRIMEAYRDYRPLSLGIEKGALQQAVLPYLEDEMKRLNIFFLPTDLSHGNKAKPDRIRWALQGRAEKGRIFLKKGEWTKEFISQSLDFPSPLGHDDMLDAVSYIDQLASTIYLEEEDLAMINSWTPIDEISGF